MCVERGYLYMEEMGNKIADTRSELVGARGVMGTHTHTPSQQRPDCARMIFSNSSFLLLFVCF